MFFLLRVAFWLGLVLVLLPRDNSDDKAAMPKIGTSDAVTAATAAVSDLTQFCTRQPAACEIGGQAATAIGHRAQGGAKTLYKMITDKKPDTTGGIGDASSDDNDTLNASDIAIAWRVPQRAPLSE